MNPLIRQLEAALSARVAAIRASHQRLRTDDAEALHDLRVAVRRLRAVLAPWREREHFQSLRQPLRELAAAMADSSEQRDREAQRQWLLRLVPRPDARLRAWLDAQPPVAGAEHAVNFRDLAPLIGATTRQLSRRLHSALRRDSARQLFAERAALAHRLLFRIQSALGHEAELVQMPRALHALRLDCKRLRYLLEAEEVAAVTTLRQAQQVLGDWHDVDALLAALRQADVLSLAAERRLLQAQKQLLQSAVNALQDLGALSEADLS